jgi:hypothetical protein
MHYMLLLYGTETDEDFSEMSQEAQDEMMKGWFAYDDALKAAGVFVAGEALQPTATATSVRIRDGKEMVTDGPFAETTEALGGYYLLDVKDLDEAVKWSKQCPATFYGTVEVRPGMVLPPRPE